MRAGILPPVITKLFTDNLNRAVIGATVLAAGIVAIAASYNLALYVLGVGVLVLMGIAENRNEPWSRKLLPVFIAVFGLVILLNRI